MAKPSIPQGTRDFGPDVVRKRTYILQTIRAVFELYGFQPLETPAMENLDTLMGKYGEEGDKLIFKILNNGLDNPAKEGQIRADFEKVLQGKNSSGITERALKYDLTIPFARYVAMNHGQLSFPFKRYQIQPVWRADRPQKGRYREFYQCDADVVGSQALLNEVELVSIYHEVFTRLGLADYELRINSRKVLAALAEICGGADRITDITVAIDKLDKIGPDKVKEELSTRGLTGDQISIIEKYLNITGTNEEILASLSPLLGENVSGKNGIAELDKLAGAFTSPDSGHPTPGSRLASCIHFIPVLQLPAFGLLYKMGLVFLRKPAKDRTGGSGILFIIRKRLLNGRQLLYGCIQVKIKCGCNAELGQRMSYGRLYKGIDDFLVFKFNFLFGRMYVYIHHGRIKINKQNVHRVTVRRNHFLVSIHHGMIEIAASDKPVIDKKILIAPGFFSGFGFAHKTVDIHVIGLLFYGYQFRVVVGSQ